jgi:hypothetical protein
MTLFLAIVLGLVFGYILQRVGASDPDKIINMLRLSDLHLAKTIFAGIGIASILFFIALKTGLLSTSPGHSNALSAAVRGGGGRFGIGWAVSGFCPGTGVVALGSGRLDAIFFILGGLLGAGAFIKMYEALSKTILFQDILGGKTTLVQTGAGNALVSGPVAPILAYAIGIAFIFLAVRLPGTISTDNKQQKEAHHE